MQTQQTSRSNGSPKPKKRPRRLKKKRRYRIRNWSDYDTALVRRGSLTLWLDTQPLQNWHNQKRTGKRGKPRLYADQAIACALRLGAVYHLPLRATEGLLASLVALAGADVPVPDYSTLCRRRQKMQASVSCEMQASVSCSASDCPCHSDRPCHLVVDSTGLKVFGDGEWKVRQHGVSKRRTWRKIHVAVDQATGMVCAAATTSNSVSDGQMLPELLAQVSQAICQVSADGGYDRRSCYEAISRCGANATIPPRQGARIWQHGNCKQKRLARDENLRCIRRVGRAQWKRASGYHRRSLAETAIFRLKTLFGATLRARREAGQDTETKLRLDALNRMTTLGMPQSYIV